MVNVAQVIAKKRDSLRLSEEEIRSVIAQFAAGQIPDYQMSALAMAILCRGMDIEESTWLTQAMIDSGTPLTWNDRDQTGRRPKVDKHSTGGVGDKITIPLTPILACLGMDVPMISGRGLGPTGGTLDKLESIPGFQVDLERDEFIRQTQAIGCAIVAAGNDLAPADKKFYALRDVTGTVPSLPLITSSILSKKISEGLDALVMDVKYGSGAFMKTLPQAEELAQRIVSVAQSLGVKTTALITNMDRPLGKMIGNACEISESLDILSGSGPDDVKQLTLQIAAEAYQLTGLGSVEQGLKEAQQLINSGQAMEKLVELVEAQGGALDQFKNEYKRTAVGARKAGTVVGFDTEKLGYAVIEMGGGRKEQGDKLDYRVGIELLVEEGDEIQVEQPIVNILDHSNPSQATLNLIHQSILIGDQPKPKDDLIAKIIRP